MYIVTGTHKPASSVFSFYLSDGSSTGLVLVDELSSADVAFASDGERIANLFPNACHVPETLDQDQARGLYWPDMLFSTDGHASIATAFPSTKFVVVLCDPIDNIISAYHQHMRRGVLPFEQPNIGLRRILNGYEQSEWGARTLASSHYYRGLTSLADHFEESQLHIVDFNALLSDPAQTLQSIATFLNFEPSASHSVPRDGRILSRLSDRLVSLDSLEQTLIARIANRLRKGEIADVRQELDTYSSRHRYTDAPSVSLDAATWLSLWRVLLPEVLSLAKQFPSTADMVKKWLVDLSHVDSTRPPTLNAKRRHPRKSSTALDRSLSYCVGFVAGPSLAELRPVTGPILSSEETLSGGFAADPCLVRHDGEMYVFYESRSLPNAVIEVAAVDASYAVDVRGVAISEGFHVSYPQVFDDAGRLLMTVESMAAEALLLYECIDFPLSWRRRAVLARGSFIDPSPFSWNGQPYLMAQTERGHELFMLDLDQGKLSRHPNSPLTVNKDFTRMGGGVFALDDGLFRISQRGRLDGEDAYGVCTDLHRVVRLTPTICEERVEMSPFLPRPGVLDDDEWCERVHHLHVLEDEGAGLIGAIDGQDLPGLFSY